MPRDSALSGQVAIVSWQPRVRSRCSRPWAMRLRTFGANTKQKSREHSFAGFLVLQTNAARLREQLGHRRCRAIDDADWAAVGGVVLAVVVDAQGAANRGHEVEGADRAFGDGGGLGVGAADDLPAADAAPHHDARPGARVVIAAWLGAAGVD